MNKRETVLALVEKGLFSRQIGEKLDMSLSMVRYYRETGRAERKVSKVAQHRLRLKRKALDYSGSKCLKCEYDRCVVTLTFHHIDPQQKDYRIASGKTMSWEFTRAEVDKTVLLCCRCHGELHAHLWDLSQDTIFQQSKIRQEYVDKPLVYYKDAGPAP